MYIQHIYTYIEQVYDFKEDALFQKTVKFK